MIGGWRFPGPSSPDLRGWWPRWQMYGAWCGPCSSCFRQLRRVLRRLPIHVRRGGHGWLIELRSPPKNEPKLVTAGVCELMKGRPVRIIDVCIVQVWSCTCRAVLATRWRFFDLLRTGWRFPWRCVPSFSRSWWSRRGSSSPSPIRVPCRGHGIPTWRWHVWLRQRHWLQLLQDGLKDSVEGLWSVKAQKWNRRELPWLRLPKTSW